MTNLKLKLTTAVATGAILATAFAPGAMAATVKVKNNGADSKNTVKVAKKSTKVTKQANVASVANLVGVFQNTGGNEANMNTGKGDKDVSSGDADSTVTLRTTTGDNTVEGTECGCVSEDNTVVVKGNGADSKNDVTLKTSSTTKYVQYNETNILNGVVVAQNTGGNEANKNTGAGDVDVDSGNATSTVSITNTTGSNTIMVN